MLNLFGQLAYGSERTNAKNALLPWSNSTRRHHWRSYRSLLVLRPQLPRAGQAGIGTVALPILIFALEHLMHHEMPDKVFAIGYTVGMREAAKRIHGSAVSEH